MPAICHKLLVEAPIDKVFDSLTKKGDLSSWWTPEVEIIDKKKIRFHFGPDYYKEMDLLESKNSEYVKWQCVHGAEEWIGTTISFELQTASTEMLLNDHPEMKGQLEQSKNTELVIVTFQHKDWKNYTPMFSECSFTWGQFLRSLKKYSESGKGKPWPTQHH